MTVGKVVSYLEKPILKATVGDFAKMSNEVAKNSRSAALEFMADGVRTDFTPKLVRQLGTDMFTRSGKLSKGGKQEIMEAIEHRKLPKDITIKDYLQETLEYLG